jgi:D-serine deaminase-like pyridoxal phosphate-dependent protein
MTADPARYHDLPTPALVVEQATFEANLAAMSAAHPGRGRCS